MSPLRPACLDVFAGRIIAPARRFQGGRMRACAIGGPGVPRHPPYSCCGARPICSRSKQAPIVRRRVYLPAVRLAACRTLLTANISTGARRCSRRPLPASRHRLRAHHLLGLVSERQNRSGRRALLLRDRRAVSTRHLPKPTIAWGSCWDALGRTADALAAFERAVELAPRHVRCAVSPRRDPLVDQGHRWRAQPASCGRPPSTRSCGGAVLPGSHAEAAGQTAAAIEQLREAVRARSATGGGAAPAWRCALRKRVISMAPSSRSGTAVRIDPASIDARNSLGLALMQKG